MMLLPAGRRFDRVELTVLENVFQVIEDALDR
jgi:hypothetical protein